MKTASSKALRQQAPSLTPPTSTAPMATQLPPASQSTAATMPISPGSRRPPASPRSLLWYRTRSNPSGFLSALNAAGSAFRYSTFIPGTGLNSIALDTSSQTLILSGNIAPGQFPLLNVTTPLVATPYQSTLRLPLNGQSLTSSTLLVPGTASFVSPGPSDTLWVAGALTTPLFPGQTPPDYNAGDTFLLHQTSANAIDQTLRIGGQPTANPLYATLTTAPGAPAINGSSVALPATLTATTASTLLATQHFDLPLVQTPTAPLPNNLSDVLPTSASCPSSSQCTGTAGLLTLLSTAAAAPSFGLSAEDVPNLTLRNLGSAAATSVSLTASGYTIATDCPGTLQPSSTCAIALSGGGPGSITVSAANAATYTVSLPSTTAAIDPLVVGANEIDFGVLTAVDRPATRTFTLTNLSAQAQNFTAGAAVTPTDFSLTATTCGTLSALSAPAQASCTLSFTLTPNKSADKAESSYFIVAGHALRLTGFSTLEALNLSSAEVDFGTQYSGSSLLLPRYLYLSNNSATAVAHSSITLPSSSPFTVTDNCPSTLVPHSVCQIALAYSSTVVPSDDAVTLTLDQGLTVLVTGQTLAPQGVTGSATNPSLSVSATSLTFPSPVVVTQVSGTQQMLTVSNTGGSAFPLTATVTGDFLLTNGCPATLAAGSSCKLYLNFAPSQPGGRDGLLALTTSSGFAPTLVALSGTASAILPPNNGTIALGQTYAGEPLEVFLQVQQALPSLTAVASAGFGVAIVANNGTPPASLPATAFTSSVTAACGSCYLVLEYLSQAPMSSTGTLTLTTTSNGNPYILALSASALPVTGLVLTPTQQDFGPVPVASSSPALTFTLADLNADSSSVNITSVTASGDFALAPNTTGGFTCAGTLAPATSCFLQVVFAPTTTGPRNGTLTIVTPNATLTATLTGYGSPNPGLSLSPDALIFNLTPSTSAGQQTITVGNSGSASLAIGPPTEASASFTSTTNCGTLAPGATCTITVNFTPSAAPVNDTLSIPVTATQNGQSLQTTYTVPLSGTYTAQDSGLQILPSQVNFGATAIGALGLTRNFTLNNLTSTPLNVSLMLPRQFPLVDGTACTTLAAQGSCTFSVAYLPASNGPSTGTIFAQGAAQNGTAVTAQGLGYLLGYGAGSAALTITGYPIPNTPIAFAQVSSGQSSSLTLTLTNSGKVPLNPQRLTTYPPFYSTSNCTATLAVSTSCNVTITYAPVYELPLASTNLTPRTDTSTLTIESDAASSPVVLAISGTVAPTLSASPASASTLNTYTLTQGSLSFPNTAVGNASPTQTVTLSNTGTVVLHIASVTPSTDFTAQTTCSALAPGDSCAVTVSFTHSTASNTATRAGTLHIASDASSSLDFITLFGQSSAAPLTLAPNALDFGTQNVASTTTLSLAVSNTTTAPITFLALTTTGDYSAATGTCPTPGNSLAAGASCTLSVAFTPTTTGTRAGTLSLATSATTLSLTASLTGVGVAGQLNATPSALSFGSIAVGSPAPLSFTLLNSGSAIVTLSPTTITGINAADFAVTTPCSSATLAPNQGCTLTVTFTPSATGPRTAALSIPSNDPASPIVIPLTGAGVSVIGSFALTVTGATGATFTVNPGSAAMYPLTLTPINGFAGPAALTCAPVTPGTYVTCSLNPATLTLAGGPLAATLNTITTASLERPFPFNRDSISATLAVMFMPMLFLALKRRRLHTALLLIVVAITLTGLTGCGSGGPTNLRYTPPGTYQYTVTATSTTGPTISSTVTLNLIVQ
jgi:hypothetical protein